MRTLPVISNSVIFNNFRSNENEVKTTEVPVSAEPKKSIEKKEKNKSLSLVTAALAVVSLGVSAYALSRGKNSKSLGAVVEDTEQKIKNEMGKAISEAKKQADDAVRVVTEKVEKVEGDLGKAVKKIEDNQVWNNGYFDSLNGKVQDIQKRPHEINMREVMDRNWTFAGGMRLVQNTDNGGNRKLLNEQVVTKLREAAPKYISGKDALGAATLVASLGMGASVWLPSAETKPEKEGGLGEVPVQMATNYIKEYGLEHTYIPRPLIEIPGKSGIKKEENQWKYFYDNMTMDVDKVAEYEVVAYHNGVPGREKVEVFYGKDPKDGYNRLMFRNPNYFTADGLYAGSVTAEEPERYTFFSKALYTFIKLLEDPKSVPYAVIEHPNTLRNIKAPDAMVLNDWHVAPVAALMRLLAPVEASDKKLNSDIAKKFEDMNLLYIVHNADYQGNEYHHRSDLLNTLFDQYTYDIYENAYTGFTEKYNDGNIERERTIPSLRSPLTIDNNVNMANMAMALSTKVKPVSMTYAKELGEQSARSKGLQHISNARLTSGTMQGQSNGWDRSVNEVSEANLAGFNANLNKDKFIIFKHAIDNIEGLSQQEKAKIAKVYNKYGKQNDFKSFKVLIENLARLNIPVLESKLTELKIAGIMEPRMFIAATSDLSPIDLMAARKHNKELLFEHVNAMIEYNKSTGENVFNIAEMDLTDLSGYSKENISEVPFFNMGVRFVGQKGVDVVVGAWVDVLKRWDDLYPGKPRPIVNIGGFDPEAHKPYFNIVKNGKEQLGDKGKSIVHWDGFVPNNILMAGSDWTMRPSHFEPDGDKWESLYKGTPVIMSRVGGHIDSVQDGVNGFLTSRTVPEIEKSVQERGLTGKAYEAAVLQAKIDDFAEVIIKALDTFYNGKKQDAMVLNAINGNQSWVIKDKEGKIVSCPSLEHLKDLGFDLSKLSAVSESAY